MKEHVDKLTFAVKLATDILFVKNPVSTSMGVFAGVVLHGLVGLFSPFFETIRLISISSLSFFHYIALGIFGFNVPNYVSRSKVSKEVTEALTAIDNAVKEGRITKTDAKLHYKALIAKVVENVQMDAQTASRIKNITDTIGGK